MLMHSHVCTVCICSHTQLIHDELCRRLAIEDERIRLDALRKVGALSLMTAQMLPAFLTCFQDPHISVRIEASSVSHSSPNVQMYVRKYTNVV